MNKQTAPKAYPPAIYINPEGKLELLEPDEVIQMSKKDLKKLINDRNELFMAVKAAYDWCGLDGDGIDEPVRTMLINAMRIKALNIE